MVFPTNKRRGFCIDTMCANDTMSPDSMDLPRTLEYAQTESKEVMTDYTDNGTGTYTGTYTGTMNDTVDQTLSAGVNSVNIENQWTLNQNWTQEEVNKIVGNHLHYCPILEKMLTGNISDGVRVQKEVRSMKKKASAKAWLPNRNLEILALLVI